MEWIGVKDRLPEYHIDVLVFDGGEYIVAALNTKDSEGRPLFYNRFYGYIASPYWMPLPEPPEQIAP